MIKITAWGNDSGSKMWRLADPFKYLRKMGVDARLSENGINDTEANWADINIVQSCTDKNGIAYLYQLQQEMGKKLVVECDDYFEVNEDSPFKFEHEKFDAKFVITQTMRVANMITTTTDYLAKKLKEFNSNVVVLPNCMDMERWKVPILKNNTKKFRIGWVGSITHLEDMKMVVEPLRRIYREFKNILIVIVGDPRVGELFKGMPVETQTGVPFEVWPHKLASLRLDVGLAPLKDTEFNRCKSNIKWMEYAIVGVPGIFSPIVYNYESRIHFDGVYGQIAENEEQWYRCIKNYIICKDLRDDIASKARSCVTTAYDLRKNIKKWTNAYRSIL